MAIGVFGLQVAYRLKRLEVMSTDDTHGWFGGGATPTIVSRVDRVDFSNDTGTANIRGSLNSPAGRWLLAATGNSNYGWFGGGNTTPAAGSEVSTVDRIDFSNDSVSASPRGPLTLARTSLTATGNSNYGWFTGGRTGSPLADVSTVERIDFSNDSSTTSPRGSLTSVKQKLAATGNSNYGWFGGGQGPVSTVNRIDFSNDNATASPRSPLSSARGYLGATGNSNYGWFGGGFPAVSTVDRIDFSNDSVTASVRGPLSSTRFALAATGNSNYGWFAGGSGPLATIDRIDFSNDSSTVSSRGPLSSVRQWLGATSGQAKGPAIKLAKTLGYGWFGGGTNPSPGLIVDRINFSNDSVSASPRGPLTVARQQMNAATSNSNYGWFIGGRVPGAGLPISEIDRIDFSNDSGTASVRGRLTVARYGVAATGNSNYGWVAGSPIESINYSNDSVTASVRGSSSLGGSAATGNSNYGWFSGNSVLTVDRIDFSNDLATPSPRGTLNTAKLSVAATGNSNYGWFGGGGQTQPGPLYSTVDRIDFSNDSTTASVRGLLSQARTQLTATGNSNYGWFGGGDVFTPPSTSNVQATVDRIDFSNDSVSASPRGPLSLARQQFAATSNTSYS